MGDIEWMILLIVLGCLFATIFIGIGVIIGAGHERLCKGERSIHNNSKFCSSGVHNHFNCDVGDDLK